MIVMPITRTAPDGRTVFLTVGRVYEVLGIECDDYRLLADELERWCPPNDPVLYEPECFSIVDSTEPPFWQCTVGEEGERYCYPPEWNVPGFFEDFHDRVAAVREQFWNDLRRYYPRTWKERFETQAPK